MAAERTYTRFSLDQRIEHVVLIVSFTTLAITGIPQKFADAGWADTMIGWMGGIETVRRLHHAAAVLLILGAVYHIIALGYRVYVSGARPAAILPGLKDIYDFFGALRYNLGLQREKPLYERYSFEEKLEYWAVVWGTIIMAMTGFVLWNPIATTHYLPGELVPISKAAHGGEALLAVLSIITWHLYHVHVRRFNKSMFTGRLTRDEMMEEHPLELARIEAGEDHTPPPSLRERRRRLYLPVSAVFTIVSLFLVYGFVTLEITAIQTIPPQPTQVVFQRAIPQPTPQIAQRSQSGEAPPIPHSLLEHENCLRCHAKGTIRPFPDDHAGFGNDVCLNCHVQVPDAEETAVAGVEIPSFRTDIKPALEENCVVCHGVAGGLNLSSYSWLMAGGQDGPVIVPGEPDQSLIVRVLEAGHFADLPAETQQALSDWISAGAPNN